jgi:hypothetical protein
VAVIVITQYDRQGLQLALGLPWRRYSGMHGLRVRLTALPRPAGCPRFSAFMSMAAFAMVTIPDVRRALSSHQALSWAVSVVVYAVLVACRRGEAYALRRVVTQRWMRNW